MDGNEQGSGITMQQQALLRILWFELTSDMTFRALHRSLIDRRR